MKTFISETIDKLYAVFGERISDLNVLLPSKRARLFFNEELTARLKDRPIWQPNYLSVDTLMQRISGLRNPERLRLIAELYKIYSRYHRESFDSFYYWGEVLLSDFDMIDNYRVNAEQLFVNLNDLKDIDRAFAYLEPEQAEAVRRFWKTFRDERHSASAQQKSFLSVWNTLLPVYSAFRERLQDAGYGYKGMIYRHAAEKILRQEAPDLLGKTAAGFAVIGFNALSASEKILFGHLQEKYDALFFWDDDAYYTDDTTQEAGLFIRENRKRFSCASGEAKQHYLTPKTITIVDSPSDALQCKYVWDFLSRTERQAAATGKTPGKETAVVLTDESLLLPILYSIPPKIEHFNVTSGYPLQLTAAYSLVEYLIQLQQNRTTDESGRIRFYHKDIAGILYHPYIQAILSESEKQRVNDLLAGLQADQRAFVDMETLQADESIRPLFIPCSTTRQMSDYLTAVLDTVVKGFQRQGGSRQERDYLYQTQKAVLQTTNTIENCRIELSIPTFLSFLRKHLKRINIAFEGDPLTGIQIMGILETRNLDFENVLLLSVNEDNFPGRLVDTSYIPANLRAGYGLPTLNYHEAMYSYYFYRLLQRARNIDIVYCSKNDGLSSGEPSRFIQQLRLEKGHAVLEKSIDIHVTMSPRAEVPAVKDASVQTVLKRYLTGKRTLSPSALYKYIQCPYAFYLSYIAGIREPVEISDEPDASDFGSVMHESLQEIYMRIQGKPDGTEALKQMPETEIRRTVERHIEKRFDMPSERNGAIVSSRRFLTRYVQNVIKFDIRTATPFILNSTEEPIEGDIVFDLNGRPEQVKIKGIIDRTDRLPSGTVRLIDYKSGTLKNKARDLSDLFRPENETPGIAVFQILLYALLYSEKYKTEIVPVLYFARHMEDEGYTGLIRIGKEEITRFSAVAAVYEEELKKILQELFDPSIPFCRNRNSCEYCPYASLCL